MQSELIRPATQFLSKRQNKTGSDQRKNINQLKINFGFLDDQPKQKIIFKQKSQQSFPIEKEKLQEELTQVKLKLNFLENQNNSLKQRNRKLEVDVNKKSYLFLSPKYQQAKLSMDSFYSSDSKNKERVQSLHQQNLINRYKVRIDELQNEINKKDNLIQELKRNKYLLQNTELSIQLEQYKQETQRLQQLLINPLPNDQAQLFNVINTLKADNIALTATIAQQNQQIQTIQILQSKNIKLTSEKLSLKRLIAQYDKENTELKQRDPFQNFQQQGANQVEFQLKKDIQKLRNENQQQVNILMLKEKKIIEIERKMKEFHQEMSQKTKLYQKEIQELMDLVQQQQKEMKALTSVPKRKVTTMFRTQNPDLERQQSTYRNSLIASSHEPHLNLSCSEQEKLERLEAVSKDQVVNIGKKVRYRLKIERIGLIDIGKYLFEPDRTTVSIEQLYNSFQRNPFNLEENESLLLSRYLVEDSDEKMVHFQSELDSPTIRVKSILRNLIGDYTIIQIEDEECFLQEIKNLVNTQLIKIVDYIMKGNTEVCDFGDFEEAFEVIDNDFSQSQIDYLYQVNFILTESVTKVSFMKLIEYFNNSNKQQKEIQHDSSNSNQSLEGLDIIKQKSYDLQKQEEIDIDQNHNQDQELDQYSHDDPINLKDNDSY